MGRINFAELDLVTLITFVAGTVLGWWLLQGFCSVLQIGFDYYCGHNGPLMLILFCPIGWVIVYLVMRRLVR